MENVQKAAQLLQVPDALIFNNGLLKSTQNFKILKKEINDFTAPGPGYTTTIEFESYSETIVSGVQPSPEDAPNSSAYALNQLSFLVAPGGFAYEYTGETSGVHRVYLPHYEGIDTDPLSGNYNLYHWYNWGEILIEQTAADEVRWIWTSEPGYNTYGFYDDSPEHPVGSPTPPNDYSVLRILVKTESYVLDESGLTLGATYNSYITIQEVLDNSNWTIEDIIQYRRSILLWDTDVDHTQFVTSIGVDVPQLYSRGANSTVSGEVYINGIIHTDIPFSTLTTSYYQTMPGFKKRWKHYNQAHFDMGAYGTSWNSGNMFSTNDDTTITLKYMAPNDITWNDSFDEVNKVMQYTDESYLVFDFEENPAQGKNLGVGIQINLATGARYIW
jgi:hypothetical protein